MHIGMKASVRFKELSKQFEVGNGVKQDYVLVQIPFYIFSDTFTDSTKKVWIQSRLGANLFNSSQFKSQKDQ